MEVASNFMTDSNNDVDVNSLIKVYQQKISTLTNQNILLEAKLHTLTQDYMEEKQSLLVSNAELKDKYDELMSDIDTENE